MTTNLLTFTPQADILRECPPNIRCGGTPGGDYCGIILLGSDNVNPDGPDENGGLPAMTLFF